jgi:hypothetical protein
MRRRRLSLFLYINAPAHHERMPLNAILSSMEKPVGPDNIKHLIKYMKSMPKEHEPLVLECAECLEKSQSLGTVLAVVHALNEGEFLLKCRDDDVSDLDIADEFERLLADPS